MSSVIVTSAAALHLWTPAAMVGAGGAIPYNPRAPALHSWSVGAWLALVSLILWGTAIAWYIYGHHRVAAHVSMILWRVGLSKTEPVVEKKTKRPKR